MKKVLSILVFTCYALVGYSQSTTQFGVTAEGSWFMPQPPNNSREYSTKAGFGTGIGVYASRDIFWRVSADIGLRYRYKEMQQYYVIPSYFTSTNNNGQAENGYGGYENNSVEGWGKYPLHYIVVPFHLQLRYSKTHFIRGGIESTWLTNYDAGNNKTEYNWTVGWGSQKHKLKWSVNYIRGFKEVGFVNGLYEIENGKYRSATVYRNQILQLNLYYPIWQKQ